MHIDDEFLLAANLTEAEMRTELAAVLHQKRKLLMGKVAILAGIPRSHFQFLLASREIPVNYDVEDLKQDLETIQRNEQKRQVLNDAGE